VRIKCKKCGQEKEACKDNFYWRKDSQRWVTPCKACVRAEYDPIERKKINREQYVKSRTRILQAKKKYRASNLDKLNKYNAKYKRDRYANDPCYRLRMIFSSRIRKGVSGKKNGDSFLRHLPYSLEELKRHLEASFEPWMHWENYGVYNPNTWDDDDSSTWTWNIDHSIPHSEFSYDTMEHPDFQKCWALDNLRPLSSKQNCLDGTARTRHAN